MALVVLVVNDHFLKNSGVVPSWLTGKLSDFAGLIVAPVLLVVLTRASGNRARFACFAAVAAGFSAIQLSPGLARLVTSFSPDIVHLCLWSDPTDLVALSVLPLAWWIVYRMQNDIGVRLGRGMLHRVGIAVAAIACMATTINEGPPIVAPFIANHSHLPIEVSVRYYEWAIDCDSLKLDEDRAAQESDFSQPTVETIRPAEIVGIGRTTNDTCGAAWIASEGLADLILVWNLRSDDIDDDAANTLIIEGPVNELRAYAGPGVQISDVPAPMEEQ